MRKYLLSALFTFSLFSIYAQDLNIKANVGNPSNLINDGFIDLEVEGGTPPYTYKWENQSTLLTSARSEGLVEGVPYSVVVTDSKGATSKKTYTVEAESITEHFNGALKPIVAQMEKVLFWDLFTAIGIYDPVVYADIKNVPTPGWEAGVQDRFTLKKWLKPENSRVKEGDLIATVESDNGEDLNVYANAPGTLRYLTQAGEVIYDYKNEKDVIMRGAHNLAQIVYDQPVALLHPNGDFVKKNIPFIVVWLLFGALFFTIRMGFINVRGFKHSLQLASGKYDDPDAPGQITHFQALSTAISGTVGLGNIAGVAGAHNLAQIVYDQPVALLHPNGDFVKKNIPFIVVWLLFGALFFTIRMGFINVRGFKHSLQLASGKYDDPDAPGQITHFQALSTAISGTVGLGNIAGVAVAISLGGAGATFWMILAGFLGMSSKFV